MHIFTAETCLEPGQALRLLEEARRQTSHIALIPTITFEGRDRQGWFRIARRFELAGAHAIELNICRPNMSFNAQTTGEHMEEATGPAWARIWSRCPRW
jgi:hypothetical protein